MNKEENKKYHEIDNDIKIDFEVPAILQELLDMAEESDLNNDGNYYNLADSIDIWGKNLYAEGVISAAQWETLARRYKQW